MLIAINSGEQVFFGETKKDLVLQCLESFKVERYETGGIATAGGTRIFYKVRGFFNSPPLTYSDEWTEEEAQNDAFSVIFAKLKDYKIILAKTI